MRMKKDKATNSYRLSADAHQESLWFVSESITLGEGQVNTVTVTRTGTFSDPRYGKFQITRAMLLSMVANFDEEAYGQEIFIDVAHKPENGAAGKITKLSVDGDRLMADVEWTPFGLEAIRERGYQYLSAEYHENFKDNEKGEEHGAMLLGAALTVRPVIKHLDPVRLAQDVIPNHTSHPTLYNPDLIIRLSEDLLMELKTFIEQLRKKLSELHLPDESIIKLVYAFERSAKALGDERAGIEALAGTFEEAGKHLAEDRQMLMGENLSGFLNRRIEQRMTESSGREDIIQSMASAAGIDRSTVNQILGGSIDCPPLQRLSGFATALDVPVARIRALAESDGCNYGGRQASGDGDESNDEGTQVKVLTEEDIKRVLAQHEKIRDDRNKRLADSFSGNQSRFDKLLADADGLKQLSETARKALSEARDLITAEMSEEQIRKLAEHQIKLGNEMAVQSNLAAVGYSTPAGVVHLSMDERNSVKTLQESVDKRLGIADMPESRRFANTGGALQAENKELVEKVLAEFDARNGRQLHIEHKLLAGGDGVVADVDVPAIFERTVIREALYQLVGLQFVDSGTLPFASSAQIPYSYRDTTAAGHGNTRVYQGNPIPRAGVIQASETAYPIPQKIAFEISDELRYLTGSGILNWDAVTENQRNASRIIAEDTEQMIFNEQLHAADEFGAMIVASEDLGPQMDGINRIFTLANFPVVRPRQVFDLNGIQIGSTLNPVTVTYESSVIDEYDGTGTQSAGTYYLLDYNLGEISLVDEIGAIQTPLITDTLTIGYNYATNVYAFDTDPGAADIDAHWDTFLYRYGLRKSIIEDQRFHMANFGLMSGSAMTQVEQAKQFGANSRRPGTDLASDGNLGRIKDVPNFKTSAPGLWMGDQRVIIGERAQTRLRMMKAWTMSELENQKDANGRFTGKKEAYGDQFLVMHTPTQLTRALTSIVLYSASARVDRINL